MLAGGLVVAVALVVVGLLAAAESRASARRGWAEHLTGGKVARAIAPMVANGCAGCHRIPGVPGAAGEVGPPLSRLAQRVYLGGRVTNSPDNLVEWIRNSRGLDPMTAMPSTDVPESTARDIAAYLYALP